MGLFLKDPRASVDYAIDWAAGYLDGQTIQASGWRVEPDEPQGLRVAATLSAPTRVGATLAGGIAGHLYRVSNTVTLSDGRVDERTLTLRADER